MAHARATGLTMEAYSGMQFVGIDLHRHRSVIVRTTEGGEVLETVQIVKDVERLASVMARAGKCRRWCWRPPTAGYWARCVCRRRLFLQRRKRRVRCCRDGHQTNAGRRAHRNLRPLVRKYGIRVKCRRVLDSRLFPPPDGLEIDAINAPGDGAMYFDRGPAKAEGAQAFPRP